MRGTVARRPRAGRRGLRRADVRAGRPGLLAGHASPGWCRTRCRAASSASAAWRRRSSGFWPGVVGTQFIVTRRAAAVRGVLRRRRSLHAVDLHGAVRAARPAAFRLALGGGRRRRRLGNARRRRGGRFRRSSCCRAPSSGAGASAPAGCASTGDWTEGHGHDRQAEDRRRLARPRSPCCRWRHRACFLRRWPAASGSSRSSSTRSSRRWPRTTTSATLAAARAARRPVRPQRHACWSRTGTRSTSRSSASTPRISIAPIRMLAAVAGVDERHVREIVDRHRREPSLPADRRHRGRDAGAGGGGDRAPARLRAAGRRRRAGADAAVSRRRLAAHLFGYVGEVSDAQVADDDEPEERRHRRPGRASRRSTTRC